MEARAAVNVKSPDYKKYIQELRGAGEDGGTLWGVVVPLSLLGGGSLQMGFYNSELLATERVRDYFKMLMAERESREKKNVCTGCCDGMANQEAHYGGCMSDPDESSEEFKGEPSEVVAVDLVRTTGAPRTETIITRLSEHGLLHWWACRYNVSEPEMKELVRDICGAAFQY